MKKSVLKWICISSLKPHYLINQTKTSHISYIYTHTYKYIYIYIYIFIHNKIFALRELHHCNDILKLVTEKEKKTKNSSHLQYNYAITKWHTNMQNKKSKYLEQSLIVISNKIHVYQDKNINKYVKTHPADNIHKRNPSAIKGNELWPYCRYTPISTFPGYWRHKLILKKVKH